MRRPVRVGRDSVVHSLPQLVVVCSNCRWREEAVEKMFDIVVYLVKQLVVGVSQQLIERRQVWRTKSTALATAKKCIDSWSVCCRDEAAARKYTAVLRVAMAGGRPSHKWGVAITTEIFCVNYVQNITFWVTLSVGHTCDKFTAVNCEDIVHRFDLNISRAITHSVVPPFHFLA